MTDRYEEKARETFAAALKELAASGLTGSVMLLGHEARSIFIRSISAALREQDRDRVILEARVTMLNEAHRELNGALRSASIIAEREGKDTNWPAFRETIRYSLEMSHLVINTIPPPPNAGRDTVTPRDTGGGDG